MDCSVVKESLTYDRSIYKHWDLGWTKPDNARVHTLDRKRRRPCNS